MLLWLAYLYFPLYLLAARMTVSDVSTVLFWSSCFLRVMLGNHQIHENKVTGIWKADSCWKFIKNGCQLVL